MRGSPLCNCKSLGGKLCLCTKQQFRVPGLLGVAGWCPGRDNLFIYQSIYIPTLTYGHELWVVTERMRWTEMSFLRREAGLSLRGRVGNSDILKGAWIRATAPSHWMEPLRWFRHLIRRPPWPLLLEVFRHIQLLGDSRLDPEHARGITYLIWPGNASGSPQRSWKMLLWGGTSEIPYLTCCHCNPAPNKMKKMDGLMDGFENRNVCFFWLCSKRKGSLLNAVTHCACVKGARSIVVGNGYYYCYCCRAQVNMYSCLCS